jgi:hypothetical protein
VSLRRTRRVRRKELRTAERELSGQVVELERENAGLREALARRDLAGHRSVGDAAAADLGPLAGTARSASRPPADRRVEPLYAEASRVARLRSDSYRSFPSTDHQAGPHSA